MKRPTPTSYKITVEPSGKSRSQRTIIDLRYHKADPNRVRYKVVKNGKVIGEIAHVPERGDIRLVWEAFGFVDAENPVKVGRHERKPDDEGHYGGRPSGEVSD